MVRKRRPPYLSLLALIAWMTACTSDAERSSQEEPVFLVSHAHAERMSSTELTTLELLLRSHSGTRVRLRMATSAASALSMLERGKAQVGLLTLFEYLLAHEEYGVKARLSVVRAVNANEHEYAGQLLVLSHGDITALEQLSGRRVAFVDRFSASGFILPSALLARNGIKVKSYFAGSHDKALEALRAGRVDAAATYVGFSANDPTYRVLEETESVPNEPVFVHPKLDPAVAEKLIEALETISAVPEGEELLQRLGHITSFERTSDASYQQAQQLLKAAGRSVYDVVPGGRSLNWASQPGYPL